MAVESDRDFIASYLSPQGSPLDAPNEPPPAEGTKERETYNFLASRRLRAQRREAEEADRQERIEAEEVLLEERAERLRGNRPRYLRKRDLKRGAGKRGRAHVGVAPLDAAAQDIRAWLFARRVGPLFPLIMTLALLLFFIVPVNKGETRAQLMWRALTGGAKLPLDEVGQRYQTEDEIAIFENASSEAVVADLIATASADFWTGVKTQVPFLPGGGPGSAPPLGTPASVEAELQALKVKLGLGAGQGLRPVLE